MGEPSPVAILIEDERQIRRFVRTALEGEGWVVHEADTMRQGLTDAGTRKPDLIILDLGLPDGDGVEFLRDLRGWSGVPVIVLSARVNEHEKIAALDAGADDYLTKPFEMKELSARIRALLRRPSVFSGSILQVGFLCLEPTAFKVTRHGEEIPLLPKEFALLEFMMRHPNQVFSAEALLDRVWASDSEASPETIRTYIKRLRKKIDLEGQQSILSTVHGVGYKLEVPN